MPAVGFRQLFDGLLQPGTGFVWAAQEEGRHATVEQGTHTRRLRLPERGRFSELPKETKKSGPGFSLPHESQKNPLRLFVMESQNGYPHGAVACCDGHGA